jgi:succinoglycan biosynthesis transport protein ExoP
LIPSRANLPIAAAATEPEVALPASGFEESAQGGMSMTQVICILRVYWLKSLIAFIALVAVSTVLIKLMPKVFVATATLIVNFDNKDVLAGRDFAGGQQANSFVPTQIELIMSRVILQPVAERLKLTSDPQFTRGFQGTPIALNEIVTKNLHDVLMVQQGVNSQLLYISASAKTPDRAAELANAVADEYLRQERQRTNQPAGERAERYSKQLVELREKAIAAQDRVTEFRQQNGMTNIESNFNDVEGAGLADLQSKLEAAQNLRREIETKQLDAHADSTAALDSNAVIALRSSLATQEAKMAELRETLGPKHPKVLELESQMEATRRSIANEVQSISANQGVQLARAKELEAKYQAAMNTERQRLLERRGLQDQGAKLILELQSAQAAYKKALDGYDQIMFASAGNYSDVSLISRADPPARPEKPNKLKLLMMSIVASFGMAFAIPFGYELLLNRRLRCRDDLERNFGIPVLAQLGPIPSMSG